MGGGGWLQLSECPQLTRQGDSSGSGDAVRLEFSGLVLGPRLLLWAGLGWGWEVRAELGLPIQAAPQRGSACLLRAFPCSLPSPLQFGGRKEMGCKWTCD